MITYTWFDGFILAVILFSTFISIVRGFLKETLSLMSWVLSFYLAYRYCEQLSVYLQPWIAHNSLRHGLGFVLIFLGSAVSLGLSTYFILKLLKFSGMNAFDRLFGAAFGVVRGVLIVNLFIIVGSALSLSGYYWWRHSYLVSHLKPQAVWIKTNLPGLNQKFQQLVNNQKGSTKEQLRETL